MEISLIAIEDHVPQPGNLPLPELVRSTCESILAMYKRSGFLPPWIAYLAEANGQIVGTCAFKSPPQANQVEIAYFTFPGYEGQGIATQMARRLIEIARDADETVVLTAQTLPEENASTTILRKLNFERVGMAIDPDAGQVWAWERVPQ